MKAFNTRAYNNLFTVISIILLGVGFVLSLLFYDIGHAVIIAGLIFVQAILAWKQFLPRPFMYLFPLIAFLMVLGSDDLLSLYSYYPWYDKIVHFLVEFVLTMLAFNLLVNNRLEIKNRIIFSAIIVSIGIALGALWEVVEWFLTFIVPATFEYTATDTATDLIIDSLGAILAGILAYWRLRKE